MKNTFTKTLTIFYLISSIGFGSVQHYCQLMEQYMLSEERACCSDETTETASAQEHSDDSACCAIEVTSSLGFDNDRNGSTGCCVLKSEYNQLDSSPIPFTGDLGQTTKAHDQTYHQPVKAFTSDKYAKLTLSDPATFLNIPLLI